LPPTAPIHFVPWLKYSLLPYIATSLVFNAVGAFNRGPSILLPLSTWKRSEGWWLDIDGTGGEGGSYQGGGRGNGGGSSEIESR
jgi:hypothetical protein